jgi:hypothetical protein
MTTEEGPLSKIADAIEANAIAARRAAKDGDSGKAQEFATAVRQLAEAIAAASNTRLIS